jgi:hypothetical protein
MWYNAMTPRAGIEARYRPGPRPTLTVEAGAQTTPPASEHPGPRTKQQARRARHHRAPAAKRRAAQFRAKRAAVRGIMRGGKDHQAAFSPGPRETGRTRRSAHPAGGLE